jgi:hypothetical protein
MDGHAASAKQQKRTFEGYLNRRRPIGAKASQREMDTATPPLAAWFPPGAPSVRSPRRGAITSGIAVRFQAAHDWVRPGHSIASYPSLAEFSCTAPRPRVELEQGHPLLLAKDRRVVAVQSPLTSVEDDFAATSGAARVRARRAADLGGVKKGREPNRPPRAGRERPGEASRLTLGLSRDRLCRAQWRRISIHRSVLTGGLSRPPGK